MVGFSFLVVSLSAATLVGASGMDRPDGDEGRGGGGGRGSLFFLSLGGWGKAGQGIFCMHGESRGGGRGVRYTDTHFMLWIFFGNWLILAQRMITITG